MAKKKSGRRGRSRGSARRRKFSVKALHRELDKVLKRLSKQKTASAGTLRGKIQKLRADTFCPIDMSIDLSK